TLSGPSASTASARSSRRRSRTSSSRTAVRTGSSPCDSCRRRSPNCSAAIRPQAASISSPSISKSSACTTASGSAPRSPWSPTAGRCCSRDRIRSDARCARNPGLQLSNWECEMRSAELTRGLRTGARAPAVEETRAAVARADAVLLGAVGDPSLDQAPRHLRPEFGLLALRAQLGVYANLRPVAVFPALVDRSPLKADRPEGVDVLIVRELTGG